MCMYLIRPHHIFCLCFFEGRGYSPEFVKNMAVLLSGLQKGTLVRITYGKDSICHVCPHLQNGACTSSKSAAFDQRALAGLALSYGNLYCWEDLKRQAQTLLCTMPLQNICQECEWFSICSQKARSMAQSL